jgi:hypothetical protein
MADFLLDLTRSEKGLAHMGINHHEYNALITENVPER